MSSKSVCKTALCRAQQPTVAPPCCHPSGASAFSGEVLAEQHRVVRRALKVTGDPSRHLQKQKHPHQSLCLQTARVIQLLDARVRFTREVLVDQEEGQPRTGQPELDPFEGLLMLHVYAFEAERRKQGHAPNGSCVRSTYSSKTQLSCPRCVLNPCWSPLSPTSPTSPTKLVPAFSVSWSIGGGPYNNPKFPALT